jgi:hypothetical protein
MVKFNVNSVAIHPQLSHPLLQNQKNENKNKKTYWVNILEPDDALL